MKVTIIGAGNVGATCAHILALRSVVEEIVLLDTKQGLAEAKALDITQAAAINAYDTQVIGVHNDYTAARDAQIVVITAGITRKPGMNRDDLVLTNAKIVEQVMQKVLQYAPQAIFIIVSNPLDAMTYQAHVTSGLPREKVIGMAGILDTARYRTLIAQHLKISPKDIQALLLGGHGDTMVPLPRHTTIAGIPASDLIDEKTLSKIIEKTKYGGGTFVQLMNTSAWYAPGAATAQMVEAIVKNQRRLLPVCIQLKGEYGIDKGYLGIPVILGKGGVEKIVPLKLNEKEKVLLQTSYEQVAKNIRLLSKH